MAKPRNNPPLCPLIRAAMEELLHAGASVHGWVTVTVISLDGVKYQIRRWCHPDELRPPEKPQEPNSTPGTEPGPGT